MTDEHHPPGSGLRGLPPPHYQFSSPLGKLVEKGTGIALLLVLIAGGVVIAGAAVAGLIYATLPTLGILAFYFLMYAISSQR